MISFLTLNRLEHGIELLNSISTKDFASILIYLKEEKSEEELIKIKKSLSLSDTEFDFSLQCLYYICTQSSKVILKPKDFQKQLREDLHLNAEKSEIFVKNWIEETKESFGNFEDRLKLKNINCELNLGIGTMLSVKETIPGVRLQFEVEQVNGEKADFMLDLQEEELLNVYENLEVIQKKLDGGVKN